MRLVNPGAILDMVFREVHNLAWKPFCIRSVGIGVFIKVDIFFLELWRECGAPRLLELESRSGSIKKPSFFFC